LMYSMPPSHRSLAHVDNTLKALDSPFNIYAP
jgi:hypothetical protein